MTSDGTLRGGFEFTLSTTVVYLFMVVMQQFSRQAWLILLTS